MQLPVFLIQILMFLSIGMVGDASETGAGILADWRATAPTGLSSRAHCWLWPSWQSHWGIVWLLVVGIDNFEEWSLNRDDSEVLRVGAIYGPVVVSVAVMTLVSFQVKDLSLESCDSRKLSVDLLQLVSLLVSILANV